MRSNYLSIIFLGTLFFIGCSRTEYPKDLPTLYPVKIKMTQQEVPLVDASVFLTPADGSKWNAGGTTDSNGIVVLYTHGRYKGAAAGTYKVTVDKYEIGQEKPNAQEIYLKTGNYPESDTFSFVDIQYTNPNKTPLEIIVSKNNGYFNFDLGAAVHILLEK
jgi:hypothetical protein